MATQLKVSLRDQILDLSRQSQMGGLTAWMSERLDYLIEAGYFPEANNLQLVNDRIIEDLSNYRKETGKETVVLGMSGGVDSALTAALYKKAGYRVIGVTMPISQVQAETDRGVEACVALGIEHRHIDLTALYNATLREQSILDDQIDAILDPAEVDAKSVLIRRGNVRARLRMMTLYNLASSVGGFVASTDNLSELTAGFWTLHGDVGDLAPVQSLTKSWEIPYLAIMNGVPDSTVRAHPTDGLGISSGDEEQLGCSYLEWDIMFFTMFEALRDNRIKSTSALADHLNISGGLGGRPRYAEVFDAVARRMKNTWFKRSNPMNIVNPVQDRYDMVNLVDQVLFVPASFKKE